MRIGTLVEAPAYEPGEHAARRGSARLADARFLALIGSSAIKLPIDDRGSVVVQRKPVVQPFSQCFQVQDEQAVCR